MSLLDEGSYVQVRLLNGTAVEGTVARFGPVIEGDDGGPLGLWIERNTGGIVLVPWPPVLVEKVPQHPGLA